MSNELCLWLLYANDRNNTKSKAKWGRVFVQRRELNHIFRQKKSEKIGSKKFRFQKKYESGLDSKSGFSDLNVRSCKEKEKEKKKKRKKKEKKKKRKRKKKEIERRKASEGSALLSLFALPYVNTNGYFGD